MSLSAATSEAPMIAGRARLARWRAEESVLLHELNLARAFCTPSSTEANELVDNDADCGPVTEAKEVANEDGWLAAVVLPKEDAAPKDSGCGVVAVELAPNESGLNASGIEPRVGVSPVNSNGIVE